MCSLWAVRSMDERSKFCEFQKFVQNSENYLKEGDTEVIVTEIIDIMMLINALHLR